MIDTRFETTIDLRGEIENYRQVALIKYYKILLELDPRRDRLTMLAVIRCIDKREFLRPAFSSCRFVAVFVLGNVFRACRYNE